MGGDLRVQSHAGLGASSTLTCRARPCRARPTAAHRSQILQRRRSTRSWPTHKQTIAALVADDSTVNRRILAA
jgi:hypothetical protein